MSYCACGWRLPDDIRDRGRLLALLQAHYSMCDLADVPVFDCVDCGLPKTLNFAGTAPLHDACRQPILPRTHVFNGGSPGSGKRS